MSPPTLVPRSDATNAARVGWVSSTCSATAYRAWAARVRTSEEPQRPADPEAVVEMRAFVRHVLGTML